MERYNAAHQRQPPNLRQAIRDVRSENSVLFGGFVGLPSLEVAKVMAATNCEWLGIDAEHTPLSATSLSEMIQTMRAYSRGKTIPIVRVPTHTHEWIAWTVDAGAGGVIVPHIETVQQVQDMINAAKFPPQGHRSYPPFALLPVDGQTDATNGASWFQTANDHFAIIPQIESIKGCENAEDIFKMEAVDAVMIGRGDLTFDCGGVEEKVNTLIDALEALGKKYNKPLLSFVMSNDEIPDKIARGYNILCNVASASDAMVLSVGVNMSIAASKEVAAKYNADLKAKNAEA